MAAAKQEILEDLEADAELLGVKKKPKAGTSAEGAAGAGAVGGEAAGDAEMQDAELVRRNNICVV